MWPLEEAAKIRHFKDPPSSAEPSSSVLDDLELSTKKLVRSRKHSFDFDTRNEPPIRKPVKSSAPLVNYIKTRTPITRPKEKRQEIEIITLDDSDDDDEPPKIGRTNVIKTELNDKENRRSLKRKRNSSSETTRDSPNIDNIADDFKDLIPPDISGIEPRLFHPRVREDSVSLESSSGSGEFEELSNDEMEPSHLSTEKPKLTKLATGIDLDVKKVGPPSCLFLESLPKQSVYTCDQAGCGYTTSDPSRMETHLCVN